MVATDLQELFTNSSVSTVSMKSTETVPDFRQQYLSHSDINAYLDRLHAKYSHLVKINTIGYSFEKRPLKSISISAPVAKDSVSEPVMKKTKSTLCCINSKSRISVIIQKQKNGSTLNLKKPIILIDGGMHAREWCTISTALYCASQLTDNFDANEDLLNTFDFVIVPIVNADGYEYSRRFVRSSTINILKSNFLILILCFFMNFRRKCGENPDDRFHIHNSLGLISIGISALDGKQQVLVLQKLLYLLSHCDIVIGF